VTGVSINRIHYLSEKLGVTDVTGRLTVVVGRADSYQLMATRSGFAPQPLEFGIGRSCTGTKTVVMKGA
jgi:hypothetical protein